jgi:hypothetical protein
MAGKCEKKETTSVHKPLIIISTGLLDTLGVVRVYSGEVSDYRINLSFSVKTHDIVVQERRGSLTLALANPGSLLPKPIGRRSSKVQ